MADLYELMKAGYSNNPKLQDEFARKNNLIRDNELSNKKHQIYTSLDGSKLIHNINGTQNTDLNSILRDWNTNLQIGLGQGKNTDRYAEEKGTLEKAKLKHKPSETVITGHSQGGFHTNYIGSKDDKRITFNGAHVGGRVKGEHYRTLGDPVSVLSLGTKRTKIIGSSGAPFFGINTLFNLGVNSLDQHNIKHLKGKNIKV